MRHGLANGIRNSKHNGNVNGLGSKKSKKDINLTYEFVFDGNDYINIPRAVPNVEYLSFDLYIPSGAPENAYGILGLIVDPALPTNQAQILLNSESSGQEPLTYEDNYFFQVISDTGLNCQADLGLANNFIVPNSTDAYHNWKIEVVDKRIFKLYYDGIILQEGVALGDITISNCNANFLGWSDADFPPNGTKIKNVHGWFEPTITWTDTNRQDQIITSGKVASFQNGKTEIYATQSVVGQRPTLNITTFDSSI
jgi:hypothetical protein